MHFNDQSCLNPVEIFLVEDNPADVFLLREAFRRSHTHIHLKVAYSGEEALGYLHKREGDARIPEPRLIILDLNLPKKSGWEILTELKYDPRLKHIPVLILTGKPSPSDIRLAYHLNANTLIAKPSDLIHFELLVKYLQDFWIEHFQLQQKSLA